MNGRGAPRRLRGEAIAPAARFAQVGADAALLHRLGGAQAAVEGVRRRAGASLDPTIAAAFCRRAPALLAEVHAADAVPAAIAAEPDPHARVGEPGLDAVCRAFGEAVDLKSPFHHGHSAGVARLAEGAAQRLGVPAADVRRAALLHDLWRAAVATGIWERAGPLAHSDWEQVRLHAYRSERVLARAGPLAALAPLAGMHHERLDGSGYHREARAAAIPMSARVLAAADAAHAMGEPRPHRPALAPEQVAAQLRAHAAAARSTPRRSPRSSTPPVTTARRWARTGRRGSPSARWRSCASSPRGCRTPRSPGAWSSRGARPSTTSRTSTRRSASPAAPPPRCSPWSTTCSIAKTGRSADARAAPPASCSPVQHAPPSQRSEEATDMHEQRNKAIVRRFVEEYQTAGDERAFDELMDPGFVDHSRPPGIADGPEGVRRQFDGFRAAFAGFRAEILDQVAEGDRVVTRKVFHGVHEGEFAGIPPTGRDVQIAVIDIVRVADGRIAEHWNVVDQLGLMAQLGAVPGAAAAA